MVTVIKFGKNLRSPFYYNENKLKAGVADFIHSANYGKDTEELSRKDRIARLEKQAALHETAKLKSVHITLNFDPSEKIDRDTLRQIVDAYMQRIGYGGQPYIVYQHTDAGHPHVHVITTNIRPDGIRIPTHNFGKYISEPARQAVELEFGLVRASDHKLRQPYQTEALEPEKVIYGRTETRRAITIVLDTILERHQYTSLAELNTILRKYNVMADNGTEGSRIRQRGGLVYRVLDDKGNKVGVPIKASDIYSKPTLKFLEKRFAKNATLRQAAKTRPQPILWDPAPSAPQTRHSEEPQTPKPISLADLIPHPNPPVPEDKAEPEEERQKRKKKKRKRLHL
jgi:Relaxase/Mobilisation nuclease domain